jgi:hypothetical protein
VGLENTSYVRNKMMHADRQFEFTVDDGGLPGVFLPKVTVVRGLLSASAHERLLHDGQDLDEDGRQKLLHRAVRRRFIINGAEIRSIDVRASDITAVREDTDEGHAAWPRSDGKPHAS